MVSSDEDHKVWLHQMRTAVHFILLLIEYNNTFYISCSISFRPGVMFTTEENSPKTFPLTYTYPAEIEEIYLKQKKFDPLIDQLITETQLMRPPYRYLLYTKFG